jgi:hypothetical protein
METILKLEEYNCAGFFHWPPIWIESNTGSGISKCITTPDEDWEFEFKYKIKVRVSTLGVFIFNFSDCAPGVLNDWGRWQDTIAFRTRFMNLVLACVYSEHDSGNSPCIQKMFVDPETYVFARRFATVPDELGCSETQATLNAENLKWHKSQRPYDQTITLKTLAKGMERVDLAMERNPNEVAVLSELALYSLHLLDRAKYEASLISSWTISERCINMLWGCFLDSKKNEGGDRKDETNGLQFMNKSRKEKLNGRDFTASTITEVLSLSNAISFERYSMINQIRKIRNDWMHKCTPVSMADAYRALRLSEALLAESGFIEIKLDSSPVMCIPC